MRLHQRFISVSHLTIMSIACCALPTAVRGQSAPAPLMTRAELTVAESSLIEIRSGDPRKNAMMAAAIRPRLRDGDFQVGDRVVVTGVAHDPRTATLVVRPGRLIQLPGRPPVPLPGVLPPALPARVQLGDAEGAGATGVGGVVANLKAGVATLFGTPILRSLLFMGIPVYFSFGLWNVLLLPFAIKALHATEFEYGLQEGFTSVGFVIGSLLMARYGDRLPEGTGRVEGTLFRGTHGIGYGRRRDSNVDRTRGGHQRRGTSRTRPARTRGDGRQRGQSLGRKRRLTCLRPAHTIGGLAGRRRGV